MRSHASAASQHAIRVSSACKLVTIATIASTRGTRNARAPSNLVPHILFFFLKWPSLHRRASAFYVTHTIIPHESDLVFLTTMSKGVQRSLGCKGSPKTLPLSLVTFSPLVVVKSCWLHKHRN